MHLLLSGGTGFIGSALGPRLAQAGWTISLLTRRSGELFSPPPWASSVLTQWPDAEVFYDGIVNLAGEPVHQKRWNASIKQRLYESRIQTTQQAVVWIQKAHRRPAFLINASAVGFYGHSRNTLFTEGCAPENPGFTHTLCRDWENTARQAEAFGVRVCQLRFGMVLGKGCAALREMLPLFKWGLGAQLGDGQQWMSWIHIEDVVAALLFLLQHPELKGPFNFTAPEAVTNAVFTHTLAKVLGRWAFLKLPEKVVKLLFGEMGEIFLLKGQKAIPEKLLHAGYVFRQPHLECALKESLPHNP